MADKEKDSYLLRYPNNPEGKPPLLIFIPIAYDFYMTEDEDRDYHAETSFPALDVKRDFLEMNVGVVQFLQKRSYRPASNYNHMKEIEKNN